MGELSVNDLVSLAEGNPGAINVLCEILRRAPEILTNDFKEKATQKKLVGSNLWSHYKNIAKFDVSTLINEILK